MHPSWTAFCNSMTSSAVDFFKRTTLRTVLENKKTADPSPGSGNFHFRKRGSSKRVMSGPAHKKTSSTSMELSYTVDEEDNHFDERNE
ncbi:hypothetical protein GCK72_013029 [Caenorhabditis remanei]|uniref:Uncharacterized protein n=1 Tax=Caenorhabditis remanei TaxID=31234 RepID=A0A6A5GPX4_CAERE|nr:hypothetical protein GCK72_013029 [Caenorhabditis remanei]KAF1756576.1 hypothetical protein GCK72_013029 [Caenorhabditis remanei]